jgi:hypothetical protein
LKFWSLILVTLIGCNVANEPAVLSAGSDAGGGSGETVGFSYGYYTISEAAPMLTLPITYSNPTAAASTLSFSFGGTAVGGVSCTGVEDYINPGATLNVNGGLASTVLDITLCNDNIYEGSETLTVTIAGSSAGYSLSTYGAITVQIIDSHVPPSVAFELAASAAVNEGVSGLTTIPVTVELSHATTQTVTVELTSTGTATGVADIAAGSTNELDYYLSTTQLTFSPGVTTATVLVYVIGDNYIEPNENISLSLFNAGNASVGSQSDHNLTISQDEGATTLVASLAGAPTLEETDGAITIPVTITGELDEPATLRYSIDYSVAIPMRRAVFGEDYTLTGFAGQTGQVTIPAGATSVDIGITVINDDFFEATEQFVVRILGGGTVDVDPGFETLVIDIDPDAADDQPLISFQTSGARLPETNTSGNITIRLLDPNNPLLEKASGEDIEVQLLLDNDTTAAGDYVFSDTTVTIPAGTSRVNVPITVVQDGATEGSEFLDITIDSTTPASYTVSPIGTFRLEITDN